MTHPLIRCFLLAVACLAMTASYTLAQATRPVTDFTTDVAPLDGRYPDACFTLRFAAIRPLPGRDEGGDVYVQLHRVGGQWASTGHTAAADYNQRSDNTVHIDAVTWDGRTLSGRVRVTIRPDQPRPRVVGFPSPADEFAVEFTADRRAGEFAPWQPDPQAFMPPWRRDEPTYGGEILAGRYTAVRGDVKTEGDATGAVQPSETDTHFGSRGNLVIQPAEGGGLGVLARCPPQRAMSGGRAMAARRFPQAQDWTAWDALRVTVRSPRRRDNAAVALALRTPDGRWLQVTTAAYLAAGEQETTVPLADFGIDRREVTGVAVGVDNGHGVGDVEFVVRRIDLVHTGAAPQPARTSSRISIDPQTAWSMNGVGDVPKGLFGFHDVNESKPRAAKPGEPSPTEYLAGIRPGLLRPLTHVGMGGTRPLSDEQVRQKLADRPAKRDSVFVERARAADALDGVVWTHTFDLWARPPWMDETIERSVAGAEAFYRNLAADAYVPGDEDNPLRYLEVLNEPFMWARHINMGKLNPAGKKAWTDPTQYGFLPAKLGADVWASMFLAAAKGAKGVNRHVRLGGPSSPEFAADDFGMFETYLVPILDRCHRELDFLTEHHYGGNPRTFAAGYEVMTAWCDVRYGRRIPTYVTETNDLGASSAGRASYNIEDILTCVRQTPDKVKGRALHALWDGYLRDEGELHAYTLLSTLRGRLIVADSDDEDLTTVAATPQAGTLVVVAHNRASAAKTIQLEGADALTLAETVLLVASSQGPELQLKDTEGQSVQPARGKTTLAKVTAVDGTFTLPGRSAIRWTFRRDGYVPARQRQTEQHFTDALLARVGPNSPVAAKLVWREKGPGPAVAARLRVLTRDVERGEGVVLINGVAVPLPRSSSNEGQVVVQDVPLDLSLLREPMSLEFRCTDPQRHNGFRVYGASICIDR